MYVIITDDVTIDEMGQMKERERERETNTEEKMKNGYSIDTIDPNFQC